MLRFKLIIIFFLFILLNVHSQSYIDLLKGETYETIKCDKIEIKGYTVIYKPIGNKKTIEVNQRRLKGYYSEIENTYYHQKNGFKKRIVEGNINVYSALFSEEKYMNHPILGLPANNMSYRVERYSKWYLEKGSQLKHFFNQKTRSSLARENNLKKEILKTNMSDDSISVKELSLLKKKPKIKNLLKIIKDYNVRYFLKTKDNQEIQPDFSKITILRDGGQHKNPLKFTLNDKNYVLERNSKLDLSIPNNKLSLICITNASTNSCDLIRSSSSFHTYFGLKLNKKGKGSISKINGNSSYFKARLADYEKKSSKKN